MGTREVTYADLPMIECPHCGRESQHDDYYDTEAGDTLECRHCGRTIHVLSVDTRIAAILGTEPDEEA